MFGKFLAAEAIAAIDPNSPEARAVVLMIVDRLPIGAGNGNEYDYQNASALLIKFGRSASAGVPGLVAAMKDGPDAYTRVRIGSMLASIRPDGKAAALAELAAIARGDLLEASPYRYETARAVLIIDPVSPEALSLLPAARSRHGRDEIRFGAIRGRVDDPPPSPGSPPRPCR